jgi:MFS family permease
VRGRSALRFYNARLFLGGLALSNIGTFSQVIALSLLVLELTDSGIALGAVMAVQAVPMLLLAPWAGTLLDRLPLRKVMIVTALTGAAQATCLAILAITGTISMPWVFALSLMLGFIQVFDRPASQAFIVELVPRESIPSAVSLGSAAQAIGRLGGPALAAVLYTLSGAGTVFAVNAISYAAVVIALLLLRSSELLSRPTHHASRATFKAALTYAWHAGEVRAVLLANVLVGLLAFNFATFFASIASLTFQEPSLFGIAETINAITSLAGGFILSRYMHHPTTTMVGWACLALGSSLLWAALAPTPLWFLASMPYFGFVVVWYVTSSQSLVQQRTPAEMGGRMMSLYTLGSMGTTPLGALIVGVVTDHYSPRAAIGLGAASALVSGAVLLVTALLDRRS